MFNKKYKVIQMDPPWSNRDLVVPRAEDPSVPYPVCPLERIKQLPILELSLTECHLYVWCMPHFVPQAIHLTQHWGFKYYNLLTWAKPSGYGWNWVNRTEHIVFAFRDKLVMASKGIENLMYAKSREHSWKPEISHQIMERVSFSPRLEMFARRPRAGWDVWGNEVEPSTEELKGIKI